MTSQRKIQSNVTHQRVLKYLPQGSIYGRHKLHSENCQPLYLVSCLNRLFYSLGRSLKGTKSTKKKRVLGHNFASRTHVSSKELLAQSKQGAETEPCNTNRGLERQI